MNVYPPGSLSPSLSPVAKVEGLAMPLMGSILRMLSTIAVDRSRADSRAHTAALIKRRAHSQGQWPQV